MTVIELQELTKRFPGKRPIPGVREGQSPQYAVRDLDLTVEAGEVFGFLGPNGAGKSTTINVLLDYVQPTEGTATVLGMDAQAETKAIHDRIGVLPENVDLWRRRTASEHVALAAETNGVDVDTGAMLERVGLGGAADQPVGGFSTGMVQRLVLGLALVGEPDLLILDEPTAGLDPNGVRRLREIVREEVDRGAAVFFSSHVLEQVEAVADRVAILRAGELVAVDSIDGLRREAGVGQTLTVDLADDADVSGAVESVDGVASVTQSGGTVRVDCSTGPAKVDAFDAIRDAGATVHDFDVEAADLETLFATYAGDGTAGDEAPSDPGERTGDDDRLHDETSDDHPGDEARAAES